jgi:hypothetical protein
MFKKTARVVAAVGALALMTPTAWADNLVADGDVTTTAVDDALGFGEVCTGETVTKDVKLVINRQGSTNGTNTFANNAVVTLSSPGLAFSKDANNNTINTITLPSNWASSIANNTDSTSLTAKASYTAPATVPTTNPVTGSIAVAAAGLNSGGSPITRNSSLSTSATVKNCAVADTTAPTLTLPAPITAEATGASGASVTYSVSANDANPTSPAVTCATGVTATSAGTAVTSPATFSIGTTTVTCKATDAANNTGTGSFTVTVRDTTAPTLNDVPANITGREATSAAGASVAFSAPTATDLVDGSRTVTCATGVTATSAGTTVTSGATFPLGTTTVTCSATDSRNNAASGTFNVTVVDTTGPVIGDITAAQLVGEATSADGAQVNYTVPSATDAVTGSATVACLPDSGSQFKLGTTLITCKATDGTNPSQKTFNMVVKDTTAPVLVATDDIIKEATGPSGAAVTYSPTATDAVDGPTPVTCNPVSGTVFALDATSDVTCSTADSRGNSISDGFTVTVRDTTAPTLTGVTHKTGIEATSANGAAVTFAVTANDLVDGAVGVTCAKGVTDTSAGTPVTSGDTFPLGTTKVTCSATDSRTNTGSGSFNVTVVDTTAPELSTVTNKTGIEATSASGAVVTYTRPTATDAVGAGPVSCTPASGATFALDTTTVTCSAKDAANNVGTTSFTVTVVDTTAPTLSLPASQEIKATGLDGAVANWNTPTASDLVDGSVSVSCSSASGALFPIGTTTVNCTATDAAKNTVQGSFLINVQRTFTGFYQPVDTGRTVNLVKAGSTLPLKFEVFAGSTELSALDIFKPLSAKTVACSANETVAEIETLTSGSTALKYENGQYIWNWKTPSKAGTCYQVAVITVDGAELTAQFKLR